MGFFSNLFSSENKYVSNKREGKRAADSAFYQAITNLMHENNITDGEELKQLYLNELFIETLKCAREYMKNQRNSNLRKTEDNVLLKLDKLLRLRDEQHRRLGDAKNKVAGKIVTVVDIRNELVRALNKIKPGTFNKGLVFTLFETILRWEKFQLTRIVRSLESRNAMIQKELKEQDTTLQELETIIKKSGLEKTVIAIRNKKLENEQIESASYQPDKDTKLDVIADLIAESKAEESKRANPDAEQTAASKPDSTNTAEGDNDNSAESITPESITQSHGM